MCDGPHAGFARQLTPVAQNGERQYTEETPSGAAPTSPSEGVFRHTRRLELDEQQADSDALGLLQPTPSEGRQSWHYYTLSSPHLPPSPLTISDDYGPHELLENGHRRSFRLGRRSFPGTTGRTQQRADDLCFFLSNGMDLTLLIWIVINTGWSFFS